MAEVRIFWDPQGTTIDSLGAKEFLRATDGDTPFISVSIRMLSIDSPEVHYPGNSKPSKQDEKLAQLADWMVAGKAPCGEAMAAFLHPRLATGRAGTLQQEQGEQAREIFEKLLDRLLTRENGSKRSLFIRTADQPFDAYGRLLAYISPSYTSEELADLGPWERATFNALMVKSGWAAPFIIYPSLPSYDDLVLMREAGKEAYMAGRGVWDEPLSLTGYEFRMAVKLFEVTEKLVKGEKVSKAQREGWVDRYCVDMTTREIYYPQDYMRVAPYNRIFIWPQDVTDAVSKLNLEPAG